MPYIINGKLVFPTEHNSRTDDMKRTIEAIGLEVSRLEGLRDSAIAQAANPQDAELARVALQADIDRAKERLAQAEEQLTLMEE